MKRYAFYSNEAPAPVAPSTSQGVSALPPVVVGPSAGGAPVTSAANAPERTYSPSASWTFLSYGGGTGAANNGTPRDGSLYYEVRLFARIPSFVDLYFKPEPSEANGGDAGYFDVLVDGVVAGSGNNVAAAASPVSTLFATVKVPAGEHLVRVRKYEGRSLYAAEIKMRTVAQPPNGFSGFFAGDSVEQTDSRFSYSPGWNPQSGASYHGGNGFYLETVGAYVDFTFFGSQFAFYSAGDSNYQGVENIFVDGQTYTGNQARANSLLPPADGVRCWYVSPLLPVGVHTVRLQNVSGKYMVMDYTKFF